MLFMVVEHFRDNDMVPVYRRLRQDGRSLPEGLEYVDSWIETNFSRCFQLMRCDDLRHIQPRILEWRGCGVTFEIVPVCHERGGAGDRRALSRAAGAAGLKSGSRLAWQVDNVTFWVHPWPAGRGTGRIREAIGANVSFAL
jgi:hypothetical protein